MLIAMLLLVLFLGIATYWVYRSAEKIVDQRREQAAPAATPGAAPSTAPSTAPAPAPAQTAPLHQSSSSAAPSLP